MKKFAPSLILFALLLAICFVGCDLFTGPKIDVLQKISDEKHWADAPKLSVRIEFPSIWGTSIPQQGNITPAMDIRLDYEFSVEFTPDSIYSLHAWLAYYTSDLEKLTDSGSWVENPDLIKKIQSLGPEDITLPDPVQSGGTFNFTIHTTEPVTLVPSCDTKPRITRTEPLDIKSSSQPVSRAADIVLYFNGALNRDTVNFADTKDAVGIHITCETDEDIYDNIDENWYGAPEYAAYGGFFTVTMYCITMPPPNSLMTVNVKGIKNAQGEEMDEAGYSFSWRTSSAKDVYFKSWSAKYLDNEGRIEFSYEPEGGDDIKLHYRFNKGSKIDLDKNVKAIVGVQKIDDTGVRSGVQIKGVCEYEIIIELYEKGIMENKASIKIWNIPGMEVSKDNPAVEVRTAPELEAINTLNTEKNNLNKQYVLANDITITGEWTPIGSKSDNNQYDAPFYGNFYGNGHTIIFKGSIGGTSVHLGLFGYVESSSASRPVVIRDFTFEYTNEATIRLSDGNNINIGGVAGYMKDTAVSNVITSGGTLSITATGRNPYICLGGIVGYIEGSGIIEKCRAALSVKYTSNGHTGGINIGAIAGGTGTGIAANTITIENGYASGNITLGPKITLTRLLINGVTVAADVSAIKGSYPGVISIGGAVGTASNNTMNDITFTAGTISFSGSSVCCGGIIGSFDHSNIAGSYFTGNINTTYGNDNNENARIDLGGLIGSIDTGGNGYYFINKCRVQTNIDIKGFPNNYVGGVLGSARAYVDEGSMTITNCFFDGGKINVEDSVVINLGGFLGFSDGGGLNIINCGVLSGTITAAANFENIAGGFIGLFFPSGGAIPHNVFNCFSKINIITTGACLHHVGGFISSLLYDNIRNCYAAGTVSAVIDGDGNGTYTSCIGGLVGLSLGTIENCYALGNVLVDYSGDKNAVYAGGLVGGSFVDGTVSNCFSAGQVSARSANYVYSGGIVGSNGGEINNSAALGASVTARGPDPFIPINPEMSGVIYRGVGRIWGEGYTVNSNNYALKTMIIEEDVYDSIHPATREANNFVYDPIYTPYHTTKDGQDAASSTFLNQSFWKNTLGFDPDIWDFSRVAKDGHPRLRNVEGQ